MSHGHDHNHHGHSHSHELTSVNKAFMIGILLNSAYVVIEFAAGYLRNSLALMTDAGHNATDVFSLLLSLLAFRMMQVKSTESYTYGYKKVSILVSLVNAILLIVAVGVIFYEAFHRIYNPVPLPGLEISVIALIGVGVNGISAWLFVKGKENDINVKGAYLHLLADAVVSLAVVAGGILIYYTGLDWIDPLLSFIVGFVILKSTWSLLNDSIRLSLDGTPSSLKVAAVRDFLLSQPEISEVHHIHIWGISSSQNAMTAHVVVKNPSIESFAVAKKRIRHDLSHMGIHHVTLEPEMQSCNESCWRFHR